MGAVKREVVFESELQLASQTAVDRLQARPEQSVVHNQKINVFPGGSSQNTSGDINCGADFRHAPGIFDLQTVKRVWPVLDAPNAEILVRVFDNFRKRRHWRRPTF